MTTTLSKKYQIVIPKSVRTRMHLAEGERVHVQAIDENTALVTREPADPVEAMRGPGRDIWKKLGGTRQYLKTERVSWDKGS